mmetsp:Transcript_27017/g.39799  ORF Transcript_27017/g.39799 Transcript_27017/m.39799 type:complete len:335 (+) Transcript_27017:211-1215(+)
MQDPETVIIDVRNAYESAIGHFQPPKEGAKLIDPKMRNSIEFPKWLNSEDTQKQLNGKKVLMYCTGGIRCERATALLNQMSAVSDTLKPKGVYHCRGGIERYVKTFPSGGYWKGKNYLFDRRMEQTPSIKNAETVEQGITAKCCLCRTKWTSYRGQFKCNRSLCRVPVIVCELCTIVATKNPESLSCELCREGYRAPSNVPDLVALKRKADNIVSIPSDTARPSSKKKKIYYKDRLFLRRLPLSITATKIKEELGPNRVKFIKWLIDHENGNFYGSCMLEMFSENDAKHVIEKASTKMGIQVERKKIKVSEAFITGDENLFVGFIQKEYPPIGY